MGRLTVQRCDPAGERIPREPPDFGEEVNGLFQFGSSKPVFCSAAAAGFVVRPGSAACNNYWWAVQAEPFEWA